MQRLRDRAADAAGRSSHQRRPASQIEHQRLPSAACLRMIFSENRFTLFRIMR
jgi:hypothetical protein